MEDSFIHVGYPKCASTALQVQFFSQHPELFYLGPYTGGLDFGWYNNPVKNLIEVDWRLMKDFGYDKERAASTIRACYKDFRDSGKKKFGFSWEGFVFTMHHDIDVTQKAARLADVFGHGTKIIIITRSQLDLIKSLYRNLIVVGLASSFSKFISDVFYNKFRSFIYDFNFLEMYNLYAHHFGTENVLVLPYEYLKRDSARFFETLSAHIGVTCTTRSVPQQNESQSDAFYEHFRELNATFRHSMGLSVCDPINQYRFAEYFEDVERIPLPPIAELEKTLQPMLWNVAMEKSRSSTLKIQYDIEPFIERWLMQYYGETNSKLAATLNLPLRELGYPG